MLQIIAFWVLYVHKKRWNPAFFFENNIIYDLKMTELIVNYTYHSEPAAYVKVPKPAESCLQVTKKYVSYVAWFS